MIITESTIDDLQCFICRYDKGTAGPLMAIGVMCRFSSNFL